MSDVCKNWYGQYKKNYDKYIDLFDTNIHECLKEITGSSVNNAVWRYLKIHGAIMRMGGFANFSHYVNKCADDDYKTFEKLEKENKELRECVEGLLNIGGSTAQDTIARWSRNEAKAKSILDKYKG